MKIKMLLICLLLSITTLGIWLISLKPPPILQKLVPTENIGDIVISRPLWGSKGTSLIFVDTGRFSAADLGRRSAAIGIASVVIDARQFLQSVNTETGQCVDAQPIADTINALIKKWATPSLNRLLIVGIAEGALIPFLNAEATSENATANISIDFSVNLPGYPALCHPLSGQKINPQNTLAQVSALKGKWRSVWTDHPPAETAVFIKSLANADTRIAAYDTPLDTVLIDELTASVSQTDADSPPMPVVEVPVIKPGATVTLFYSGDGGWRDLDRTVAGEMAALNYPVVGIDVLRYFWTHKTPEQAAADLAATMAFYRKKWGIKSFVLAGYSFGADILPAVYNRLPTHDKDDVSLLVLLALANNADFEIHVSGWLGQNADEHPQRPELAPIPKAKILCIYGKEEKAETACTSLLNSEAKVLELPGGHHFDQDYPKLTRQILDIYNQHGIN